MVKADIGGDSRQRSEHVGGVQTSPEANFDNGDIDSSAGEMIKRQRGDYFEKSEFFFTITER